MSGETLSVALEREHQEIDADLQKFLQQLSADTTNTAALTTALTGLRRHIYLEEELLFPPLQQGARMMSIFGMIRGHGEIWQTMDTLDELVSTAAGHDRIAETARQLLTLLAAHNKVEEPVIYPGADNDLTPEQATTLADFIKSGAMPAGWVCAKMR